MTKEQTRENRFSCRGKASLFLSDRKGQNAMTKRIHGQLFDISCHGASLALAQIITERRHLAYAPMESDQFNLAIVFYLDDEELILPVETKWFNKKINGEELPFRLGMEFGRPLSPEQLTKICTS